MRKVNEEDFTTILAIIAITRDYQVTRITMSLCFYIYCLVYLLYISLFTHSLLQKFTNSSTFI